MICDVFLARINTVAFGHSADSALDFRCHLKQLADIGRALRQKYSLVSLLVVWRLNLRHGKLR